MRVIGTVVIVAFCLKAKIKELEEKLREERLHRQVLQERAIDVS